VRPARTQPACRLGAARPARAVEKVQPAGAVGRRLDMGNSPVPEARRKTIAMPPMSAPVQRRRRSALAAVGARRRPGGGGAAVRGPGRGVAPGPPRRRGGPGALQGEFDLAVERHDEARTQLAALQVEVNDTQATVETLIARSAGNHEQAETIVRALYRGAGQHAVTAVLPADGIGDAGRRLGYLGAGQPAQDAVLERLVSDRVAMEADLARLGEARSAATATEAELDRMRFDVESMLADQEREVSELEAAIARAVAEHAAREQASAPGTRVPGAAASRAAGAGRTRRGADAR